MTVQPDEDLQAVVDGEIRLLQPQVRRAPADVDALLDPEFSEFGASGRRWSRSEILTSLASEEREAAAAAHDLRATWIAEGVVLVTYVSDDGERRCNRSSIWRRTPAGWRVYFHQGTPVSG
ncbi:MAG TPA: DUF4440 domain-containing protein [Streptosporangiaceae bacterium]|nr:DUF4440 domain-containing protein [Streptosporangiaceae bacterium]